MIFQNALLKSLETHNENIAIESGNSLVSYSQLFYLANKITHFLLSQNLEAETVIGLQFKDKENLIYSIIGALNARCVIVPIDSSLPTKRLQTITNVLNLQYIITSKDNAPLDVETDNQIERFYIEDMLYYESSVKDIQYPAYNANDSIYIYFTSGSTGKPKGIIGKNCSLLQFLEWEIDTFNIDPNTRVSQFISPYFDAFLRDIFAPLLSGGTICIPPIDDDFFTPEKITSWIDTSNINLIHCVPSLFRLINNISISTDIYKHLKNVLLSGEKIVPSDLTNWYDTFGSRIQLANLYGATETTMIRFCYLIKPEDVNLSKTPIGLPIRDTQFLIADKDLKPCNVFVPGDLYIISEYTTKGYLNAPELTKERFLKIKSGTSDNAIAFKTGDKARLMPGGAIDLLGREDRQVKLRGIRVELDEIENILVQLDGIRNAVVIKHTEDNGNVDGSKEVATTNESLIAFVISTEKFASDNINEVVLRHLESHLPSYMLPSNVIQVSEFPLLDNGKINYSGLLDCLTVNEVIAPVNEIEEKVLSIWKEILGDKEISTEDSFHSIGGNSLAIMRLIGKIYKDFNIRFSLSELFNNLTIKKQAKHIKRSSKDSVLTISKTELKQSYHLTSAQERIYFNYELNKESTAFNLPMAWKLRGDFDLVRLQKAFLQLIDRHESLRTAFKFENGKLNQVVKPTVEFEIEEITDMVNNLDQVVSDFVRPFDLADTPLIRCGLISNQNDNIMVVDIHHIVCDGMSQNNLFADLIRLYKGESLTPLTLQYKDYAEWEYSFKTTDEYITHREFWLKSFEGEIPTLQLPVSKIEVMNNKDTGASVSFEIEIKRVKKITDELRKEEVTIFSVLYSIFFMYLTQLTGQDDIVIGINTSGRIQEELEDVVGMFTKTLPIRYQLDANLTFKELAKELNTHLIKANSAQIYDLSDIVREINNSRIASVKSLFDAMLVFQNFEEKKVQLDNVEFSSYDFENKTNKYPLTLFASEGNDAMYFRLEYSRLHFSLNDIKVIIEQFTNLVKKISENLDASIVDHLGDNMDMSLMNEDEITFNF
jgi:mycobactin peptide synthetase MbtE